MIKVDLKRGIYVPTHPKASVYHNFGKVVLKIGTGIMEMITPAAHRLAFELIRKQSQALSGDYVIMSINNVEINLLPREAKRIGANLLKYSDDADDFQIGVTI